MYCSNCGKEIGEDQKFCPNCGAEIVKSAEPSKKVEKAIEGEEGEKKTNSIKCFVFGIIAASCAALAYIGGGGYLLRLIIVYYGNYAVILDTPSLLALLLAVIISIYVLHILGIIFGVLARSSNKKAKDLETDNGFRKAGSILGLLGLILNILGLIIITGIILLVLALYFEIITF